MSKFIGSLESLFESLNAPPPMTPHVSHSFGLRHAGSRTLVKRIPRPYWEERGWIKDGHFYDGDFQTRYGSWPGSADVSPSGRVVLYIHHPPIQLWRHKHWPCFFRRKGGWYFVHSSTPMRDLSAGIIAVETIINEAYEI